MKTLRQLIGRLGEDQALDYLLKQGLSLVVSNYSTRGGEVDHIMLHDGSLVFVEVRKRGHGARVDAASSVTPAKQQRIRRAAKHFLLTERHHAHRTVRFDVVAIDNEQLNWIAGAF